MQPPIITVTIVELNNTSNKNKHTRITPPTYLHSNKKQQEHSSVTKPHTQLLDTQDSFDSPMRYRIRVTITCHLTNAFLSLLNIIEIINTVAAIS